LEGAIRVARQINNAFSEKIMIEDLSLDLGVSIGISVFPNDGENATDLLKNSDQAMYKAKSQRKNSFHVFNKVLKEEIMFEQALKNALEKNEFKINYQNIVDSDHSPYCIEALLRWESPEFGNITPLEFIPILEKNRCIQKIGEWSFREVCKKLKALNNENNQQNILISVNISQYQMEDEFFIKKIDDIIRETNVSPNNIMMEITGKTYIKNAEKIKNIMIRLKEIGIRLLALDDFGSGYSSFSNLTRLPLDIVKLDNFFAKNLYVEKHRCMTLNLINLIKNYNLKVIAEGVETKEQFDYLVEMGCDYFQGFYISKPQKDILL
jgi:EAL domain-containing protein (putative c-di-GMP-specific phosphodiesterase class I)